MQEPIHIPDDRMERYGENCASELLDHPGSPLYASSLRREVRRALRAILRTDRRVDEYARLTGEPGDGPMPEELTWLMENRELAAQTCRRLGERLRGCEALPGGRSSVLAFRLADGCADGLTPERLASFLRGVQKKFTLTEAECDLFPWMICLAAVRRFREIGEQAAAMLGAYAAGDRANHFGAEALLHRLRLRGETDRELELCAASADGFHRTHTAGLRRAVQLMRNSVCRETSSVMRQTSALEAVLNRDPDGTYPKMDENSRAWYRQLVCRAAKKRRIAETAVAEACLRSAGQAADGAADRHVGAWILRLPEITVPRRRTAAVYRTANLLLPPLFAAVLGVLTHSVWAALSSLFPLWEVIRALLLYFFSRLARPDCLPSLELAKGVPEEGTTLVAIALLASDASQVQAHAELLEGYYLANRRAGDHIRYCLLLDLPDSDERVSPGDQAILDAARSAVGRLNDRHGRRFAAVWRGRTFQPADSVWMARERKRGAIMAVAAAASGEPDQEDPLQFCGVTQRELETVRYLLALDADTAPEPDGIRVLLGTALHPLNRAVTAGDGSRVVSGFGIFQPRITLELAAANATLFSRICAGLGGTDPYSFAGGDLQQDLFGNTIFVGKGLIDLRVMHRVLHDRFADGRILSHDLLEGSFLRAGFVGTAPMIDGFPSSVRSWCKRQSRWIRGDVQLIPYLCRRFRGRRGQICANPLSAGDKLRILDNLRRAWTPTSVLLALTAYGAFPSVPTAAAAVCALAALASPLLLNSMERVRNFTNRVTTRTHSTVWAGVRGGLLQMAVRFLLLPMESFSTACAVLTALWRMTVTHRGLLEWTTAAEAEKRPRHTGIPQEYRAFLPSFFLPAAAAVAGRNAIAAGLLTVWLTAPVWSHFLSRKLRNDPNLSESDRDFLTEQARRMWAYFDERMTAEEHWLPPDHAQTEPSTSAVHRTSPTNIGLSLLAILAAERLGMIPWAEAVRRLTGTVSTLEQLETYRGHLFNWYDTRTLAVLAPAAISSVDSGNLCASLLTASQIVSERGASQLADRMRTLAAADFTAFYDEDRRLMRIAIDRNGEPVGGFYDMLASESRLTSYLAIASGQIPANHWRALSRQLSESGGYAGLVSWGGSLFEMLMPFLLLPREENSLLSESGRYAVSCQRGYCRRMGVPWGISESSCFVFDNEMRLQYRPHGVPTLGLMAGLDRELVVSPYSSMLALTVEPEEAVRNLRRLDAIPGVSGRYGLYEAVDYTPGRVPAGEYRVCRCHMAHHTAMSLCAVCNLLTEAETGEPFFPAAAMRNGELRSCRSLLAERVPVNAVNVRRLNTQPVRRIGADAAPEHTLFPDPYDVTPETTVFSNRAATLTASANGATRLTWRGLSAYLTGTVMPTDRAGVAAVFSHDGVALSATAAPAGAPFPHRCRFTQREVTYSAQSPTVSLSERVLLAETEPAEVRTVTVTNRSDQPADGHVILFFHPLCGDELTFEGHPAYDRMRLCAVPADNGLTALRMDPSGAVTAAVALVCDREGAVFTADGDRILRGGDCRSAAALCGRLDDSVSGYARIPVLRAVFPVVIPPGESCTVRFAIALGDSRETSASAAAHALSAPARAARYHLACARRLRLTDREYARALRLLPSLLFRAGNPAAKADGASREALWQLGISGDLPVVLLRLDGLLPEKRPTAVFFAVRQHRLLTSCGIRYDLCLAADDGGGYDRPDHRLCCSAVDVAGSADLLRQKGGVHLLELAELTDGQLDALELVSCQQPRKSARRMAAAYPSAPRRFVWSQPLCHEDFGCLTTDRGLNHLWYRNSRLLKITGWSPDGASEDLWALVGDVRVPVLRGGSCRFLPGVTEWTNTVGGRSVTVRACVVPNASVRMVEICADAPMTFDWLAVPLMGEFQRDSVGVVTQSGLDPGCVIAQNRFLRGFGTVSAAFAVWPPPDGIALTREDALAGRYAAEPAPYGRVASFRVTGSRVLLVTAAADSPEEAARLASSRADPARAETTFSGAVRERERLTEGLSLFTGCEPMDEYVSRWLTWQLKGSRLWSRSSQYQNGGAVGFRDQLQDCAAMLIDEPERMRRQLLLAAAHQYEAGDVQHWFHTGFSDGKDVGVRTLCSDDLLWLPLYTAMYVRRTGDRSVLNTRIPYLVSAPLGHGERERYEPSVPGVISGTLFDHCLRAVRLFLDRGVGEHGLPRMLGGDWNDGMNLVGIGGRGESVWLGWFGSLVLRRFSVLCAETGESDTTKEFADASDRLFRASLATFDGTRFPRAWTDAGSVIGVEASDGCRIDSVAQSFAWIAAPDDLSDESRAAMRVALDTALRSLTDRGAGIVRLFTPPLSDRADVGYVSAYPPGVRENGGQYTHGAIWLAMACFAADRADDGWELLRLLAPKPHDGDLYGGEDFVLAADVCGEGRRTGECGWSWYTGSAGWYRRAVLEAMLGVSVIPGELTVIPNLPSALDVCAVSVKIDGAFVRLTIFRSANGRTKRIRLPPSGETVNVEIR